MAARDLMKRVERAERSLQATAICAFADYHQTPEEAADEMRKAYGAPPGAPVTVLTWGDYVRPKRH